jgi:hypothetical protein
MQFGECKTRKTSQLAAQITQVQLSAPGNNNEGLIGPRQHVGHRFCRLQRCSQKARRIKTRGIGKKQRNATVHLKEEKNYIFPQIIHFLFVFLFSYRSYNNASRSGDGIGSAAGSRQLQLFSHSQSRLIYAGH